MRASAHQKASLGSLSVARRSENERNTSMYLMRIGGFAKFMRGWWGRVVQKEERNGSKNMAEHLPAMKAAS